FPLVSRSGRIRKLVSEHREPAISRVELLCLPGGSETFELAAKFCYGINFEITPSNVAQLCCVSDYLEMNEDFSNNNLGSRADEYLNYVVCQNLEMSVEVLNQCENLLPLADELKIVSRCIDAVASKACVEQIASSFSRLEYSSSGRLHMSRQKCEADWWIKDLSILRIDLYQRVIVAMKCRGVRPESIGESLMNYAQKELTKKPNGQLKVAMAGGSSDHERLVVETILSPEAGAHAAQNERLPLQSIVQVLYIEQLRLRNALYCSELGESHKLPVHHQSWRINSGALSTTMSPKDNYASLRRENRELKLELARLRMRLNDLEKEHVCMKMNMEKSNSRKFMSSFSKKISKLNLFGHSSSRGSTSPSRNSQRTDSKVTVRTE
ncbi:BTB/POZ fold, partial [Cynara cardunculus var. scolymus]